MDTFDWKDPKKRDLAPSFDDAEIKIDSSKMWRVSSYVCTCSIRGEKCQRRVQLAYDDSWDVSIPQVVEVDFCDVKGKKLNSESSKYSNVSSRVPEDVEFTLEHYGLTTPKSESKSWWPLIASILGVAVFLGLAVRFFRRR